MAKAPTLAEWRGRLEAGGHRIVESARETVTGFTLWPDKNITVAVEPDATLRRQFRQRFFLCEPKAEQVFQLTGCPQRHRARWLELVAAQPPGYWQDFLAGPGSWLLSRLASFNEVIAWSEDGLPWDQLDCSTHRAWGMEVPTAAAPFFAPTDGPEICQPRLLPVGDERFTDAVAACVLFASVGMRDCYLADVAAAEVYLAHHHDKVVATVPDAGACGMLLQEIKGASWLFADVSGYASTMDDDENASD